MTADTQTAGAAQGWGRSPYAIAALGSRLLFRSAFRLTVVNPERIPAHGPLIVVANHESFLDGPLLASVFTKRRLTFFSSSYLFKRLPVESQGGNLTSLKQAIAILREDGTMRSVEPAVSVGRVGLALGTGSARGLAHIGVLKVLEREDLPIDLIDGRSRTAALARSQRGRVRCHAVVTAAGEPSTTTQR